MTLVSESKIQEKSIISGDNKSTHHQFLKFHLHPDFTALIEIKLVTELISVPIDRVVPIPHLSPAVMGVYNWRGEILWVVDFGKLLGHSIRAPHDYRLLPTIILTSTSTLGSEPKTIGFVVDEIAEIEWSESDVIFGKTGSNSTINHLNPELSLWVKGYCHSTTGEILMILDDRAIIDRINLHSNI